jgi:hypothetical protein
MNRKGAAIAVSGVSVMLLAGSTALAIESGAFATHPVDRVGTFQSIQAGLVLHAESTSSPAATATPTASSSTMRPEHPDRVTRPTGSVATTGPISVPRTVPEVAPTNAPDTSSPTVPVTASGRGDVTAVQPTTPPTIARRAPSTSVRRPDDDGDDDHEPPERQRPGSDD